ncbi:hypothetical protein TNCV_3491701 [Trichonephila clavipes]|nr:hypothetical protein TNCV_3491701 [Trichonephila clavipes]
MGHGSGALVFLESKQASLRFLDILADQVHPAMLHFHPDVDGYTSWTTMQLYIALEVLKIGSPKSNRLPTPSLANAYSIS